MGQFNASLRLPGDSKALAATVHIQEGRLQVASGEHVIGDWELAAIDISRIPEGIRVAAEGEVLLLDIADRAAFEEEAASLNGKAKRSGRRRRPRVPAHPVPPPPASPRRSRSRSRAARESTASWSA
jgi:hypothetical protein